MSKYVSKVFVNPHATDLAQYPREIVEIMAACRANDIRYPLVVIIVHDPGCNIFSDPTIPLRDHDCTPVSVSTQGRRTPDR